MAHDLRNAQWHKSSFSADQGECVEVAANLPGVLAVRDSKNPARPALVFRPEEWAAFLSGVKRGEL
ncbi:MAG: regulatory protein [Sphaerisporangium sp.]|nr:regulatory protein [Sphaerisporangium sp.]